MKGVVSIWLLLCLSSSLDKNGMFYHMARFRSANLFIFFFFFSSIWILLDCTSVLSFGFVYFLGLHFNLLVGFSVMPLIFFKSSRFFFKFFFRERKGRRERERDVSEEHESAAFHMHPNPGSNQQPRYLPWLVIKLETFCCTERHSNQLSDLATVVPLLFKASLRVLIHSYFLKLYLELILYHFT